MLEELGKIEAELLQHREQSTCTTFEPADLESQTHDYPSWRQERLRVATAQLEQAQRAQQPAGRGRQSTEAALADIDDIIDTVTDSLGGGKPAADVFRRVHGTVLARRHPGGTRGTRAGQPVRVAAHTHLRWQSGGLSESGAAAGDIGELVA